MPYVDIYKTARDVLGKSLTVKTCVWSGYFDPKKKVMFLGPRAELRDLRVRQLVRIDHEHVRLYTEPVVVADLSAWAWEHDSWTKVDLTIDAPC